MKKKRSIAAMVNAAPLSGEKWEKIASYGDHPSRDRKKIQRFGKPQAEAMVASFNSVWHQMGTLFRGVPIYHGHPDVLPQEYTDDRRLGKIVELEAREDGLYGVPEFNSLGKENQSEGWWVYPSPAWLSPPAAGSVITPDELLSVGLVNTPNLAGSDPWANAGEIDAEDEPSNPTNPESEIIMKEKLLALLGLAATVTDDEIIAAVTTLKTDAADKVTAEEAATAANTAANNAAVARTDEEKKKNDAVLALANSRRATANVLVNTAIRLGTLTEADRVTSINSLSAEGADIEALSKPLLDKKASINTGPLDLGGRKVSISTARERNDAIQAEVNSRMSAQGVNYTEAYKSVKADPQFARLFDAMKKPGETAE